MSSMAELTSPEEDHFRKRVVTSHLYPQPSPASTPIASAARLPTPNSHTRFNYHPQPSPTHTPIVSACRLTTPNSHTTFNYPLESSPIYTPIASSIFPTVVRRRPVVRHSDSEGGFSPFDVRVGGTCSAGGSEGHSERSALGFRGWGFPPSAVPSRLGHAATKRQLNLGGPSQPREGAAQLRHTLRTTSAQHIPSIALEAEAIADNLLLNSGTKGEGHQLHTLLPFFRDGTYGFHDLQPFLLRSLQGVNPSVYSHPSEGEDDATPAWHVQPRKRLTQNSTEEEKNLKLRCPFEREVDLVAIKSMSTDACKCDSHRTVTLDAMKEFREERAALNATGKRDQLNDLVEELVTRDEKGKLVLKGKRSLHGVPLCAQVWKAILKVHNCSVKTSSRMPSTTV